MALPRNVFEIFDVKEYNDLEIRVIGDSRSLKVILFDSLPRVSYCLPTVTLSRKCTVFEIWRHIGRKSPKKPTQFLFGTFRGTNFWTSHTLPKTTIMGLSCIWCTFHDPAFALAGTIPACDGRMDGQTDRHVAVAKTALWIGSRG